MKKKSSIKRIKSILTVFLLAVTAAGLCISCDTSSPEIPPTEGKITLSPVDSKELVWTANTEVSEYVYKATPMFTGTASGAASDWQHLSFGGAGAIGELTQGKWKFEIQGRNNKGTTITVGAVEAYIEAGKENVVSIQMQTDPSLGVGSVVYNVWTQNVSVKGSTLKVYDKAKGASSFTLINTHSDITVDNPRFTGTLSNLTAGYHEILFMLFDANGATLSGEQLGIQVVAGEQTSVSGILEPSAEKDLTISIKSMGYIHAELFPENGIEVEGEGREKTAYIERGDEVTFTWQDLSDATSHPTEWIWALDGEVISNSTNSYTVKYDTYGEHELSVIGIRRDSDGVAWDAGSAVIRIVVVRHICEITFEANGGFFPDGKNIAIISEDTTIPEERKIPGGQPYDGLSPQKTGYRLTGWVDSTTGTQVVTIAADGTVTFLDAFVTKEETRKLKAVWEAQSYTLTINWYENVKARGTSVAYTETFTVKSNANLSSYLDAAPTRQGFKFLNYTTEENGRGDEVKYNDTFSWGKDTTIWVNWEYIPITVSYYKCYSDYLNGKAAYKTTVVGSDLRYGSLPQPIRQGKVFKGWAQPEDIDGTEIETDENGNTYLWDALKSGKSYVSVTTYVTKYYDHALIAVWGEGTIKVSFDIGGVTLSTKGQESLDNFAKDSSGTYYKFGALGTQYGALPFTGIETEVLDGMEFMGWYDSAAYNMQVYDVSVLTTNADHTLYAKWMGQKITVSYDTGTGEILADKTVRFNNPYGELPEVTRTGYDFAGWTYNGQTITADTTVTTSVSHTLTAAWTPKVTSLTLALQGGTITGGTEYTIDYDAQYKTAKNDNGTLAASTTSGLKEPTMYGYDFSGWYMNPGAAGNKVTATTVNKNDNAQTIYATWTAHTHTITFYNNWPDIDETKSKAATSTSMCNFGTSYGDLPQLTVTGYTFNGWYTAKEGGTRVSATTKYEVDEDISLYARWSIAKITISFAEDGVACVDENKTVLSPVERTWGSTYGDLPTPYKYGYKFQDKWWVTGRYDSSGQKVYVTSSTVVKYTEDITLTPVWEPEKILLIVPKDATIVKGTTSTVTIGASEFSVKTTNDTISEIDQTNAQVYEVTFGERFNSCVSATLNSDGTWTAGSGAALPTYTKEGYWQDAWYIYDGNTSNKITAVNETNYVESFGTGPEFEEYVGQGFSKTIGGTTVTSWPSKFIFLIPHWREVSYTINFYNYLIASDGTTSAAADAPIMQSKSITHGQTFGSVLGDDILSWAEWPTYRIEYVEINNTKQTDVDRIAGVDDKAANGVITIGYYWKKLYYRYKLTQNNNYNLFAVADILSGSSNGLYSGSNGWYDFSGTVNEKAYTKLRKGDSNLTLISLTSPSGSSCNYTPVSASWTAPANMTINYSSSPSKYQLTEKCNVCNGAGQTGYESKTDLYDYIDWNSYERTSETETTRMRVRHYNENEGHWENDYWTETDTTIRTYYLRYQADYMYDFCPNGCKNWTHINSSNASKTYGQWVVCPNCNGQYADKRYSLLVVSYSTDSCNVCSGTGEVRCSNCKGKGKTTCINCSGAGDIICSQCGGNGTISRTCSSCGGSGNVTETVLEEKTTTIECSQCTGAGCNACGNSGYYTKIIYETKEQVASCSSCGGTGTNEVACSNCMGKEKFTCSVCKGRGEVSCSTCGGDGKVSCSTCDGDGEVVNTTYTYYNCKCYCEYQSLTVGGVSKPGYIWLSGYRVNSYQYGTDTVSVNGSTLISSSNGFSSSTTVNENAVISATRTPVTSSQYLVDLVSSNYLRVMDKYSDFYNYALAGAGDGSILKLDYDDYSYLNSRYLISNGNSISTTPSQQYYTYPRAIPVEQYANGELKAATEQVSGSANTNSFVSDKTLSFTAVTSDGSTYSGTPISVTWDDDSVTVQYLDSSNVDCTFTWYKRGQNEKYRGNICKSFDLEFWTSTPVS